MKVRPKLSKPLRPGYTTGGSAMAVATVNALLKITVAGNGRDRFNVQE